MDRPRLLAVLELAIAAAIFAGANFLDVVPVSETPWILALGWISLRLRGQGLRSVGLRRPASWRRTILVAAATAIALQLLSIHVTEPLLTRLTGQPLDLSRFRPVVGNLPLAAFYLVVIWTLAAFGEELVYRGYLLNRAADLGGGTPIAFVTSCVIIAVLFGLGHVYQGATGALDSVISGLVLGACYLLAGRNLWLPILTHGFIDTIGLGLVFLDLVPQVHR
jgi:membrane protease YdiL (CAAX protease family)